MPLLLLSLLALSTATAQEGVLEIDIRDELGAKFPAEEAYIEVYGPGNSSKAGSEWKGTRKKIRYGQYRIKVEAAGFYRQVQTVNHRDPVTKVRVGMSLGYVGHCIVPSGRWEGSEFDCLHSTVRIQANPAPKPGRDVWVRLFPLHSGEPSSSRRFRPDGTIEFGGLQDTVYFLVVAETTGSTGNPVHVWAKRLIEPRFFYDEGRDVVEIKAVK